MNAGFADIPCEVFFLAIKIRYTYYSEWKDNFTKSVHE